MKDRWNKRVFNWCWNDHSVGAETTVSGSEFQVCEAATGKARPPIIDGGKFEIRYFQVIGAGKAECLSTRYVNDTSEWSQVSRRGIVKNFVAQYCNLILYALRDPQPVKADECICCCLLILIDYWFLQQQLSHFSHNSNLEVIVHLYPFPVPFHTSWVFLALAV